MNQSHDSNHKLENRQFFPREIDSEVCLYLHEGRKQPNIVASFWFRGFILQKGRTSNGRGRSKSNERLFHPISRDYGFYPPRGSFDAAQGP